MQTQVHYTPDLSLGVTNRKSRKFGHAFLLLALFISLGALAAVRPIAVLIVVAVAVVLWLGRLLLKSFMRSGLELWQAPLLIALSGYMILNYGFSNLAFHVGGAPLIVSYSLMYGALILAVFSRPDLVKRGLKEPAVVCFGVLLLLTFLHLVSNLPTYGFWAIRDSSLFLDGLFLIPGVVWITSRSSAALLMKWLMLVFMLNLIYSLTRPWEDRILAWSPQSGVFVPVSLIGHYRGSYFYLLSGALFCILMARYVVKWPRWLLLFLATAQVFGLAIHQARSTYVGLAASMILLMVLGKSKESMGLAFTVSSVLGVILLLTSVWGFEIPGRIGPVDLDFFSQHVRSISGAQDTPGMSVGDRVDWYDEAFKRFRNNPILGEGFGLPLLDEVDNTTGAAIRQPHNSNISVIARMGVVGLAVWLSFHLALVSRFVHAYRHRKKYDNQTRDFVLWLFLYYVTFMIVAGVEPAFEFPEGAIPFYFFMGIALRVTRWRTRSKAGIGASEDPRVLCERTGIGTLRTSG